jgi:hypothetical protein
MFQAGARLHTGQFSMTISAVAGSVLSDNQHSGSKRGLTPALKKLLRRRSAIEPEIGHMKTDGRLARCPLKGTRGDAIFAVLCGCGHNLRKILNHIRKLLTLHAARHDHQSYSS